MSQTYRKKQHKLHKVKMQSSNKTFQNQLKWYLLSPTAKESNVDIIHLTYLQPVARTWIAFSLDFWNSRFQCLQSTLAHPHQCLHLWTVRLAQWCKSWVLFGHAILEKSVMSNINITLSGCNTVNTKRVRLRIKKFLTMIIGYKLYFLSEKLRKMPLIYPFFFSYHPILDFATQRSVFYLCKIIAELRYLQLNVFLSFLPGVSGIAKLNKMPLKPTRKDKDTFSWRYLGFVLLYFDFWTILVYGSFDGSSH